MLVAIVRAQNSIGWGTYSNPNSVGVTINNVPSQMAAPTQGSSTTPSQIEINWVALQGQYTGNSPITSYNLQVQIAPNVW